MSGHFARTNDWRAATFVEIHELFDERQGVEADALGVELDESAAVDRRGDAMEVFVFHFLYNLDEHPRLGGDLRGGEALGFTCGSEGFSEWGIHFRWLEVRGS